MAILSTDLKYYLSGGSSNNSPAASLGSGISTTEVASGLHNLFDIISSAEAQAGDTEYRCIYLKNTSAQSLFDAGVYITTNTPSDDTHIQIGLGTSSLGGTEQTVADESTAPVGVSFFDANGEVNALSIGTMTAGQHKAVWVKRTVAADSAAADADNAVITFLGATGG
jgi:hypothetical protein